MSEERKLASIRRIAAIDPIEGADRIVKATVDGWELVTQKSNNFQVGDLVVYFEIDSLLPEIPEFKFLRPYFVTKSVNGPGFRLKTIKLRGQISQGLILPIDPIYVQEINGEQWFTDNCGTPVCPYQEGEDLTEYFNVKKYEKPIPAELAGTIRGNFPSFIKKTDQERIQNCFKEWSDLWRNEEFEVTLKLDGSSFTAYYLQQSEKNPIARFGVCSRNLDLIETETNAFWRVARKLNLEEKLASLGHSVAIQGELMGPGVQGNREGLLDLDLYVFDMFNIDTFKYMYAPERHEFCAKNWLEHVPIIEYAAVFSGFMSAKDFLEYAERPSLNHKQAEGIVFKSIKFPCYSFKAISNAFLMAGGD